MEASKAAIETLRSNIIVSSIIIVLILIIIFLVYKSAPATPAKRTETMSSDARELDSLIAQLDAKQKD